MRSWFFSLSVFESIDLCLLKNLPEKWRAKMLPKTRPKNSCEKKTISKCSSEDFFTRRKTAQNTVKTSVSKKAVSNCFLINYRTILLIKTTSKNCNRKWTVSKYSRKNVEYENAARNTVKKMFPRENRVEIFVET